MDFGGQGNLDRQNKDVVNVSSGRRRGEGGV